MRYTKTALLTFGAGLVLALAVIAAELDELERLASAVMALGIAAIPVGMAVDWRLATRAAAKPPKRGGKPRTRRAAPATRRRPRPRKPASPSRR
jgi:hypothetical protein